MTMLVLPLTSKGEEICQSNNLGQDIACLRQLGMSIDKYTEEYLTWVKDMKAQLEKFNNDSANCIILRKRQEAYPDFKVLQTIREKCEGPWLEDRLRRFDSIRDTYDSTRQRYERLRELYNVANEILNALDARQKDLEREYERSQQYMR